jgi:2-polyprenyl-3-methyl-5-hydroxy-6-metoxy-1,4-benzoquinol methylase
MYANLPVIKEFEMSNNVYRDRIIVPIVAGKSVLDCGGINHSWIDADREKGFWLHSLIAEHASKCIGIDILGEHVARVNQEGQYQFIEGNVEELEFDSEYEIVVGGEIIEHLYNPGRFLDSAWRALKPNGQLLLTTPNFLGISRLSISIATGRERVHPEHTCYYSAKTLEYVVSRHGFHVEWVKLVGRRSKLPPIQWLRDVACWFRPVLNETLVLLATKTESQKKYEGIW